MKTYTDRYVTDVITDLAIDFMKNRPRNKPFLLMMHHKATHRPWQPDASHGKRFTNRWIPEPQTFWDSYATRTDALHENKQRVAADLTRRDLKLQPPAGLEGAELTGWLATKPDTVTIHDVGVRHTAGLQPFLGAPSHRERAILQTQRRKVRIDVDAPICFLLIS